MSQEELGRTFYALAKDFLLQASADQGVTRPSGVGAGGHPSVHPAA
ncbi:MAG: hypothetical protein M3358_17380 [Actinomycetota bacterium]|nr:hypothetical protein [Actinomycetota bacterium]